MEAARGRRQAMKSPAGMLLAGALWLAACAPAAASSPAGALPPPQIRIAAGPTAQVTQAVFVTTQSASTTATAEPAEQRGVAAVAANVYGRRLMTGILIPAIHVSSHVVPVGWRMNQQAGGSAGDGEWDSPGADVGWAISSALPDETTGNILMYGHNNMYASVFRDLGSLVKGDNVFLFSAGNTWQYVVTQVSILPVLEATAAQRAAYLSYLQPGGPAQLTLISCWPPVSNTYRVVVIARPAAARP